MLTKDIKIFQQSLPKTGALLGLDIGSKTVGVAVSNPERTIAFPHKLILRNKFKDLWLILNSIIKEKQIVAIVAGYPIEMSGNEGSKCQAVRKFCTNIIQESEFTIYLQDERLSTASANRILINEADVSREKRKKLVDKIAASIILQNTLESLNNLSPLDGIDLP